MNEPHKHCDVIKAWADGARIEGHYSGSWAYDQNPAWDEDIQYRIKPESKLDVAMKALEKFANHPCYSALVSAEAKSILREIRSME